MRYSAFPSVLSLALVLLYTRSTLSTPASFLIPQEHVAHDNRYEGLAHFKANQLSNRNLAERVIPLDIPPEFRTFALEHGWHVVVSTISAVIPLTRDGLRDVGIIQLFADAFRKIQAYCAARMLANAPFDRRISLAVGSLRLRFQVSAFEGIGLIISSGSGAFC